SEEALQKLEEEKREILSRNKFTGDIETALGGAQSNASAKRTLLEAAEVTVATKTTSLKEAQAKLTATERFAEQNKGQLPTKESEKREYLKQRAALELDVKNLRSELEREKISLVATLPKLTRARERLQEGTTTKAVVDGLELEVKLLQSRIAQFDTNLEAKRK